ncbi:7,8-didemethyl-8-hydroxy-5-deazariboflavin synthase subunit CofG [Leptolyngbya sp. FACHB-36]|uniref:7,8-didemethyl-8-hydroxy-5-deazariboflavin synthase subunit CofG n=1 Tax=Leptolyngbya sp. FACHB-36 TaxID=2692808 RepID=UPI001680F901|nr:7,8-didemethyl-8-hydroxy-5-deazariboflavin synthase subunit CofG [Leptolyngbya sp. FACHB-36]MBD2019794.1 7,8-didemethyl-8-hydroxy-5-deazariboflavin synthase subunit CofG [Leptolyngbya sp. FACHB-36]
MLTSHPKTVTYSPAYTLVPTYECFNRCTYCNFRTDPGKSPWLSLTEAETRLRSLQPQGIIEILILSGEVHPHHPHRPAWLQRIYDLCDLARSLGFLPHTNVGPLSIAELERLKSVNVSMGLMVEQVTPTLLQTVHRHAPSKVPEVRLQQLAWAGELQIPFTTGLLLGLGETQADRWETLEAIARMHQRYGHIQEVILQPYSPGQNEAWKRSAFSAEDLIEVVGAARRILPEDIVLQVPPNLIQHKQHLIECLEAGARDLGGIGPQDEVNPDYPHPIDTRLADSLRNAGWTLVPRLPIYPQYDAWLSGALKAAVERWRSLLQPPTSLTTS